MGLINFVPGSERAFWANYRLARSLSVPTQPSSICLYICDHKPQPPSYCHLAVRTFFFISFSTPHSNGRKKKPNSQIPKKKKKKNCGSAAASGHASGFRGENPRATSGQEENDSGRSGSFWRKLQASTGELRRRTEVEPEVDPGPEFFHFSNFHNFCIRARIHARFVLLGSYRNF